MLYRNILLVDDDQDDIDFFVMAIDELSNLTVCTTSRNGYEALLKLVSKDIIPDLIFLDWNMPIMNGKEFLEEMKKNHDLKDIPVVILSTTADPNSIHLMKELGVIDFVTKPSSYKELLSTLDKLLKK